MKYNIFKIVNYLQTLTELDEFISKYYDFSLKNHNNHTMAISHQFKSINIISLMSKIYNQIIYHRRYDFSHSNILILDYFYQLRFNRNLFFNH